MIAANQLAHDTRTPDIETASSGYADRFRGSVGQWFLRVQEHGIRSLLTEHGFQGGKILDVGGGHGQLTRTLLDAGEMVIGHGSERRCFERQERLAEANPDQLRFVVSSLWKLPFADRSFELVTGIRLLAHVELWKELLDEMGRVADRFLVVDFPPLSSANALTPLLFRAKRRIEGNTRPYFCYWERELISYLHRLGFERCSTYRQLAVPMGVHRAIGRPRLSRAVEGALRRFGLTRIMGSPTLLIGERVSS